MKQIVLGSGPGGYVAAIKAAQRGAQVTVIEKDEVGGTCLNCGCIPAKALIASSEAFAKAKRLDEFGIEVKGEILANAQKINQRKNNIISVQAKGIRTLFKSWGITFKEGQASFISPQEIQIKSKDGSIENIKTEKTIIATGSRPAEIPLLKFDGQKIFSSTDALNLTSIPKSVLIIGAGVMGCEFACIYKELGSEVTMVEMMSRAVVLEDIEISEQLERELKKKKITLLTNAKVEQIEKIDNGVRAILSDGKEIITEKIIVSIGRTFNSDFMGLENAGIQIGEKGEILVNEKMETNAAGIYAIGDVTGKMLLAHIASKQGIVASLNASGEKALMDYDAVPAAIFTSPEIGSVGLREHQALEKGIDIIKGYFQFRNLGKAHAIGEISGFIKVIGDKKDDRILGMHIIGPHASDLIHEGAIAIKTRLKIKDIANTIHAHPTLSEGLMEASEDAHNEAIHVLKKSLKNL
ncbi:MAG: dihydrolipoyl dehydrogenase [Nitrospiraceae bacterium]|nr:dihydrolipoyl dehydrogenase [Nitrospiraceae bacterium]